MSIQVNPTSTSGTSPFLDAARLEAELKKAKAAESKPEVATSSVPAAEAAGLLLSSWAPYVGPVDSRDAVSTNGGKLAASGAPLIEIAAEPTKNQWGYAGPAAKNPYYTTPSNPLRPGYVAGYEKWFTTVNQINKYSGTSMAAPTSQHATAEGAAEALRVVQMFEPGATLDEFRFGENGGPYVEDGPTYTVRLPNGQSLNAGLVLNAYYNNGHGVTALSDVMIASEVTA